MIRSEFINQSKISKDIYVDTEATKHLFDKLSRHTKYPGFLQEINQNPFGILLISEIQVSVFSPLKLE